MGRSVEEALLAEAFIAEGVVEAERVAVAVVESRVGTLVY